MTPNDSHTTEASTDKSECGHKARGICKNIVHEEASISAKVSIDPIVEIGEIRTHCTSKPEIIQREEKCGCGKCSFIVKQHLCIEVPLAFGAVTKVDPLGMTCKSAEAGSCKCPE